MCNNSLEQQRKVKNRNFMKMYWADMREENMDRSQFDRNKLFNILLKGIFGKYYRYILHFKSYRPYRKGSFTCSFNLSFLF